MVGVVTVRARTHAHKQQQRAESVITEGEIWLSDLISYIYRALAPVCVRARARVFLGNCMRMMKLS